MAAIRQIAALKTNEECTTDCLFLVLNQSMLSKVRGESFGALFEME